MSNDLGIDIIKGLQNDVDGDEDDDDDDEEDEFLKSEEDETYKDFLQPPKEINPLISLKSVNLDDSSSDDELRTCIEKKKVL